MRTCILAALFTGSLAAGGVNAAASPELAAQLGKTLTPMGAEWAGNAVGAQLVADRQKIVGNYPGVPFPIPQSGLEAIRNHMVRYGEDSSQHYDTY